MEWHETEAKEALLQLKSRKSGLGEAEVEERLLEYGLNSIVIEKKTSAFKIFIAQFKNALVLILLFAALVCTGTGT